MLTLRQTGMQLSADEQLEWASHLLHEVVGRDISDLVWLYQNWGLASGEAKVFCALNRAAPKALTKHALLAALPNPQVKSKIIDVYICRLRQKTPVDITTIWGVGYQVREQFHIPMVLLTRSSQMMRNERWTEEQDTDLSVMWHNGSDVSVIAEELDRTERGVLLRASHLKLRVRA